MARLKYLGHASFRLISDSQRVIYIDPYAGEDYSLSPDIVLITHEHYDHNALSKLSLRKDTVIIRARNCFDNNGGYRSFGDEEIKIFSCPASNRNHPINECVGFVIYLNNKSLYFAGDTSSLPFMKEQLSKMNIDYAFLPVDGIYNMDVKEASRCAYDIKAKYSVPIHSLPGGLFSPELAERFEAPNKLVLHPDEEIEL